LTLHALSRFYLKSTLARGPKFGVNYTLLAADDFLKSFQISVETFKGTVQLSGVVGSQNAIDKAVQIARSVSGVKSVKNSLIAN
jgi:osmotically-inducible protein OsmY